MFHEVPERPPHRLWRRHDRPHSVLRRAHLRWPRQARNCRSSWMRKMSTTCVEGPAECTRHAALYRGLCFFRPVLGCHHPLHFVFTGCLS
eukprot:9628579-Prorocentrum_lima.AAC.1